MACEVDLETFAVAWADGAFAPDVREPEEYRAGCVPGARLAQLSALPEGRPVHVVCASGNRSQWVADRLTAVEADAYSVAGGSRCWARTGRPLAAGLASGSA